MSEFIPVEKGVPIRQPSTANLMVDSSDRNFTQWNYPWDFQIQKNASVLNGFFTRIGLTEVVIDWNIPNIQPTVTGNTFTVILASTSHTVTLGDNATGCAFHSVADALNEIVSGLNTQFALGTGHKFYVYQDSAYAPQGASLATEDGASFTITSTLLSNSLGFSPNVNSISLPVHPIFYPPNIQLTKYIDIVCNDLTYNQALKDGTTNAYNKDVLCRWYMAYDDTEVLDQYGFPLLMGYNAFYLRRTFSPPKQIRWDPTMPLGNMRFQVYTDQGVLLSTYDIATQTYAGDSIPGVPNGGFLLTLQASEV